MSPKIIIHLDDHQLFAQGVQLVLKEFTRPHLYRHFQHPDAALQQVKACLEGGEPLLALITDFNHPGANGYGFARAVRAMEQAYRQRVSILLFTMVGPEVEAVRKGLKEGVFDHYLSKACTKEELLHFLHTA